MDDAADDGPDEWTLQKRAARKRTLLVVLAVIAAFGLLVLYTFLTEKKKHAFGEACKETDDCEIHGVCLVGPDATVCSKYCERPKDCPAGWSCELTDEVGTSGGATGAMSKTCVKK